MQEMASEVVIHCMDDAIPAVDTRSMHIHPMTRLIDE